MNVRPKAAVTAGTLALAGVLAASAPGLPSSTCPDPAELTEGTAGALAHVRYLADDALEGRGTATDGERCAAEYVAARFEALGLQPAGDDGTWYQSFPVRTGAEVTRGMLQVAGPAERDGAVWSADADAWTGYGFAASGDVEAPLVYDGHGVNVPGSAAAREPAEGRIVVVEGAGGPGGIHSDPHFKATVAAGRGAAGVVVLLRGDAPLPDASTETRPDVGVPVAAVRGAAAETLREAAREGRAARLSMRVIPVASEARNVVARLPGREGGAGLVVLGAHYDHLGTGGEGSLAPGSRAIHNGADDNASGTAALIEAARLLTEGPGLRSDVLFIAFSGEEKGLLGSAHFVGYPTVSLERAAAMINMDMVGRLRDNTLTVYGTGTAEEWDGVVDGANRELAEPLDLTRVPDGYGPSDHASFWSAGIPVLHLFTNTHAEYHRPQDDWQTVNGEGIERVAALAAGITRRLGAAAVALTPVSATRDPHGGMPSAGPASTPGGYGPYLGTIPDMSAAVEGVRLTGVREDSPAAKAGLTGGDVIVEFAGREIGDLYAYTYALRDHAPGDEVEIVVLRSGERVTLTAVLGERR